MPLNDACLNIGGEAMRVAITHLSLHTAIPDATGSNHSTAARQAAGWGSTATGGDFSTTNRAFTGGTPGGNCTHVGFWSSAGTGSPATGGTFYGYQALTGDTTFNSAGEYTITSLIVQGTSP
jgi:hypothetical protein